MLENASMNTRKMDNEGKCVGANTTRKVRTVNAVNRFTRMHLGGERQIPMLKNASVSTYSINFEFILILSFKAYKLLLLLLV